MMSNWPRERVFLHDIGKALDHEYEGTHVDIGIQVLKKYKESEAVINGMAAHHGDYEPKSMEAVLIAAADAFQQLDLAQEEKRSMHISRDWRN